MKLSLVVVILCVAVSAFAQSDEGGTTAPDGMYPYQAALKKKNKFLCGASIINERWLLTAAHCLSTIKKEDDATIMVGTNKVSGENGAVYKVDKLISHEDYDKDFIHSNDIALIRVKNDIKFNKNVQPIKLATKDSDSKESNTAVLAGWGTFDEKKKPPPYLQHVKLQVINHDECVKKWKDSRDREIRDCQICTTGGKEENLLTHGDSGGPLVSNGVQIGVVSFAWEGLPDIFTKVTCYQDWIQQKLNKK